MWSAVNSLFLAKFLLNYTLLLYDMLYKVLRPILVSMFSNSVHEAFANTFFNWKCIKTIFFLFFFISTLNIKIKHLKNNLKNTLKNKLNKL